MIRDELPKITEQGAWASYAVRLLTDASEANAAREYFCTYWTVAGHHIRAQIADDAMLIRLLRHLLPPYEGPAMELFRGENRDRWLVGVVGLAWTPDVEIARMFGHGLNATRSGGVLLKARFEPEAIISGPSRHSRYLGEEQFTVDPFVGPKASVVEEYEAMP